MTKFTKLKYILNYEGKGNKQSSESELDGAYPFYSCSSKITSINNPSFDGKKILISTGGQFYSFLTSGKFEVSTDVLIHSVMEGVEEKFLMYYLDSYAKYINDTMFKGMGIKHLDRRAFYDINISLPDLNTQKRIAKFLDTETIKIDKMIEELTILKSNLQTHRKSLISECVTKGVPEDRNRAYIYSGFGWLGNKPVEWEVKKVKYVATINDDILSESTNPDYSFRYIEIGDVKYDNKEFTTTNLVFKDAPSRARRVVRKGDVIVSTVRTYLKAITSIREDDSNLVASTGFAVIRVKTGIIPDFLRYFFISENMSNKIISISTGTSYPSVNATQIANLHIFIPSLAEQQRVSDYLNTENSKIDSLLSEIENQVKVLKKYKNSLINEVVSGRVLV